MRAHYFNFDIYLFDRQRPTNTRTTFLARRLQAEEEIG